MHIIVLSLAGESYRTDSDAGSHEMDSNDLRQVLQCGRENSGLAALQATH